MAIRKIVGIVFIVAIAFTIALVAVVTADQPVPPPPPPQPLPGSAGPISMVPCETSKITTVTDIESHGTVTESVAYHLTLSSEDINNSLGDEELVGEIKYEASLAAVNGFTRYTNTFVADATSTPNLDDEKRIGYIADNNSLTAWLDATENGGMSRVFEGANNGTNDVGGLCAFQQDHCTPPFCTEVAAGSQQSRVTLVSASTKTSITVTESPRLHYEIDARGNDAGGYWANDAHTDGPYGVGTVSAGMKVSSTEGRTCTNNTLGPYPKAGTMTYSDMTSASGMWEFSKSMTYQSQIPSVGILRQWPVFHTPA